jgi:predicted DNA-binding transcriptional regulator YafY
MLDEKADKYDKSEFNISDYIKQNFGMFTGETTAAKIAFDESLVSVVLDRFGADTHLIKTDDNKFIINTNVSASPVFLGWIFQFGDKAEILEPESLRETMRDMINIGHNIYKKT